MKKKNTIQKSIYNSGKAELLTLSEETLKLISIKETRKSLFGDSNLLPVNIEPWDSGCSIDHKLFSSEDLEQNSLNLSNRFLIHLKIEVTASPNIEQYLYSLLPPIKFNKVTEINEKLRKLNQQFKNTHCPIACSQINILIAELRSLVNKQYFKQKTLVKRIQKNIYGLLNIDYRERFRILVINLFNCFSDCSKCDEDGISIVQTCYRNIFLNFTLNTHVQQKRNHTIFRNIYI